MTDRTFTKAMTEERFFKGLFKFTEHPYIICQKKCVQPAPRCDEGSRHYDYEFSCACFVLLWSIH